MARGFALSPGGKVLAMAIVGIAFVGSMAVASLGAKVATLELSRALLARGPHVSTTELSVGSQMGLPRASAWQAVYQIRRGDVESAAAILKRLVQDDPQNTMLYALLSEAYEGSNRFDAFADLVDLWWSVGMSGERWQRRGAADQLLRIGAKALRAGKGYEAVLALRAAWKLAPEHRDIPYYLRYAQHDVDDRLGALYPLWQGVRANPRYADLREQLGYLVDVEQVEAELARRRQVVEAEPDNADGHLELAWALFRAGRPPEDSQAEIAKGIEMAPGSPRGYTEMGDLLRHVGLEAEAVRWYERALGLGSAPPASAIVGLGMAWYYLADFDRASRYFEEAVSVDPARQAIWDLLAASHRFRGRCAPAISASQQSVSATGNLFYDLHLGQLYESCGFDQEAKATYSQILAKDPKQEIPRQLARSALDRMERQR